MAAEVDTAGLPVATRARDSRFTQLRVDRVIGLVVGGGSVFFGVQALLANLGSHEITHNKLAISIAVFASLVAMIIGCVTGWGKRSASALFAAVFITLTAVWPIIADDTGEQLGSQPWIWYLVTVATTACVMAFPLPLQVVFALAIPIEFAAMRIIQLGSSADVWMQNIFDMSFSLILGMVILILVWQFRRAARSVDEQRQRTVESYASAAAVAAVEAERTELAALMHDSVLSALIAAERADSPRERELAAQMAQDALNDLRNAEQYVVPAPDHLESIAGIAASLRRAAERMSLSLVVEERGSGTVPGTVARAITLAATQALANAVQHASARGLAVSVDGTDGIEVVVRDAGPGIDMTIVPEDRLGIRASIFARMHAVGGRASLSSDARGTRVTMGWRP